MSGLELKRLGEVLNKIERERTEPPPAIAALRLLLFTGCRRNEILEVKWQHVDFERQCLRLPESKTDAKTVPLNTAALQVLKQIERQDGNPFVIVGKKAGTRFVGLNHVWQRVRRQAGLDDVRLHDLRHSFASVGAGAGLSLPLIGKMLGHKQPSTTQRYAHISDDPLREATERVGEAISAAMHGKSAQLVVLPERGRR